MTDEAKAIGRQRAATAECVNALARKRGLQRFLVRGMQKVKSDSRALTACPLSAEHLFIGIAPAC